MWPGLSTELLEDRDGLINLDIVVRGNHVCHSLFVGLKLVCECALALNRVMEAPRIQSEADLGAVEERDKNRVKVVLLWSRNC